MLPAIQAECDYRFARSGEILLKMTSRLQEIGLPRMLGDSDTHPFLSFCSPFYRFFFEQGVRTPLDPRLVACAWFQGGCGYGF